ncbi:MAG: hypothetical protein R8G66_21215 [Cytophagales bacterium]|nr:hypothetical protein [Cytophagales bacterium]
MIKYYPLSYECNFIVFPSCRSIELRRIGQGYQLFISAEPGKAMGDRDYGYCLSVIGVDEENSSPVEGDSLTLWCFDSDKDNNSGTIEASVQKF